MVSAGPKQEDNKGLCNAIELCRWASFFYAINSLILILYAQ
jgi:hypothetical protein